MKSITKRIISTLAICGALVLEAGATAIGSLGKALNNIAKADAAGTIVTYQQSSTSAASVSSGTAPTGSSVTFSTTYTNKDQLTKGNSMTYTLSGYAGYKITALSMSMKSNSKGGTGKFSLVAGSTTIAQIASDTAFNQSAWHGSWSTSYVDVDPAMTKTDYVIQTGEDLVLTISASANSLYCQSITLTYEQGAAANQLATPSNIAYSNGTLTWNAVEHATGYKVSVNDGTASTVTTNSKTMTLSSFDEVSIVATDSTSAYTDSSAGTFKYINYGTESEPISVSDALRIAELHTNADVTDLAYVKGKLTENPTNTTYGNFHISDDGTSSNSLYVYGVTASTTAVSKSGNYWSFTNPKDFGTNSATKDLKSQDEAIFKLRLYNFSGTMEGDGLFVKMYVVKTNVDITGSDVAIKVGDADVAPTTNVTGYTLTSNNTSVVSIVNNKIHAVAEGSTTVTISKDEDNEHTYTSKTINVTVSAATEPYITPDKTAASGYTGTSEEVGVSYGNLLGTFGATSGNPSVATVDIKSNLNGRAILTIGYVAVGNTTISLKDGANELATIAVSVSLSTVTISGMPATNSVYIDKTLDLGSLITVTPTGSCGSGVTWSTTDGGKATVDSNGVVTGVAAGTTTITATPNDYSAGAVSCTVTVSEAPLETTYDFVTNFSKYVENWGNTDKQSSYLDRTISYESLRSEYDATISLHYASKQGSTITTMPVFATKTGSGSYTDVLDFTLNETDYTISHIAVTFVQWGSKTPDVALFSGTGASGTALDSITISGTTLSLDADVEDLTSFSIGYCDKNTGSNVQAGIASIDLQFKAKKSLTSIAVSNSHRSFDLGSTFVEETVTASYSDGTSGTVTGATFDGYDMDALGDQEVSVSYSDSYGSASTSYTINVHYAAATAIELNPTSADVEKGKTFDLSGVAVTISPSTADPDDYEWSITDKTEVSDSTLVGDTFTAGNNTGTVTLTCTAGSASADFIINVVDEPVPQITGFTAEGTPSKATQYRNATFALDLTGVTLKAVYDIKDPETIGSDQFNWDTTGAHPIGTYKLDEDLTVTVDSITLADDFINSISFTDSSDMSKKEYWVGDSWDFTGLAIEGKWASGLDLDVDSEKVSFTTTSTTTAAGEGLSIVVTAHYEGFEGTEPTLTVSGITIKEVEMESLSIDYTGGQPTLGEKFTFAGSITGNMSDGNTQPVDADDVTFSEIDKFITTEQTVTVTHKTTGATGTFKVQYKAFEPQKTYEYQLVDSALEDYSGQYLIVYEPDSIAMPGNNSTPGAAQAHVDISDYWVSDEHEAIKYNTSTSALSFTIEATEGGYYLYTTVDDSTVYIRSETSSKNGMQYASKPTANFINTFSYESDTGETQLHGVLSTNILHYNDNAGSSGEMFRFYKDGGQKVVQYYKLVETGSEEADLIKLNVSCSKTFNEGETLNISDLTVNGLYNDGNTKAITTGVTFSDGSSSKVLAPGDNNLTVKYGELTENITISATPLVKYNFSITIDGDQAEYTVSPALTDGKLIGGEDYTITVSAKEGYVIESVTATGATVSGNTVTITNASSDVSITVSSRALAMFGITDSTDTYATLSNTATQVKEGTTYESDVTFATGKELDTVSVTMGGVEVTGAYNNGHIKVENVSGDLVISITSKDVYFDVEYNFNHVSGVAISPETALPEKVVYNGSVSFKVEPESGYGVDTGHIMVKEDGAAKTFTYDQTTGILTVSNVTNALEIAVDAFKLAEVTKDLGDGLSISHESSPVSINNSYTLELSLADGKEITSVSVKMGGEPVDDAWNASTLTVYIANVTDDIEIKIETKTIQIPINANGNITVDPEVKDYGSESVTVTVSPKDGYAITENSLYYTIGDDDTHHTITGNSFVIESLTEEINVYGETIAVYNLSYDLTDLTHSEADPYIEKDLDTFEIVLEVDGDKSIYGIDMTTFKVEMGGEDITGDITKVVYTHDKANGKLTINLVVTELTGDIKVTAARGPRLFDVSVTGQTDLVDVTGDLEIAYDSTGSITFTPADHYHFEANGIQVVNSGSAEVLLDSQPDGSVILYFQTGVKGDVSITVAVVHDLVSVTTGTLEHITFDFTTVEHENIEYGSAVTGHFTADFGYERPISITVTCYGELLEKTDYAYNKDTGVFSIYAMGDIVISAKGTQGQVEVVATGDEHVSFNDGDGLPAITDSGLPFIATVEAEEGYKISSIVVTMNGSEVPNAYNEATGTITIQSVNDKINIAVTTVKLHSVEYDIENVTISDHIYEVVDNGTYSLIIFVNDGYELKNGAVSVTMGGEDVTADVLGEGVIFISQVTGDVQVSIKATKKSFSVSNTLTNASNSNAATTIEYGASYQAVISAVTGYENLSVTVKMGGVDVPCVNGVIIISKVTGAIEITASAIASKVNVSVDVTNVTCTIDSQQVDYNSSLEFKLTQDDNTFDYVYSVTMGGEPVDGLNGVYTIEHVTGEIVIEASATIIELESITASLEYPYNLIDYDSDFPMEWLEVIAHYNNGDSQEVTSGITIEGFERTVSGEQTITVKALGLETTVDVEVLESTIVVNVSANTVEESYDFGYEFTKFDVDVYIDMSDGITYVVVPDDISGYDITKSGEQSITVYCGEYELQITVKINASTEIESISAVANKDNLTYGDTFIASDVTVTAKYTDGLTEEISAEYVEFLGVPGKNTVVVHAAGKTCTVDVTVKASEVIDHIDALPNDISYAYGYELKASDFAVTATYTDGHEGTVDATSVVAEDLVPGLNVVVVKVGELSCNVVVKVDDSTVIDSISAVIKDGKDTVAYEGAFTPDDVTVYATYTDGKTKVVTGFTMSGFDNKHIGVNTVTITLDGKTCTVKVTVLASTVVDHIEATATKDNLTYGEAFTKDDVKVTEVYTDGHKVENLAADSISGFTGEVGVNNVTVVYGGKEATIQVTVKASEVIESIEAVVNEGKAELEYGAAFTKDDVTVTATYTDGHTAVVAADSVDFAGTVGENTVVVHVGDKTCEVKVTVKPSEVITGIEASTEKVDVQYGTAFTKDDVKAVYVYSDGHKVDAVVSSISGFNSTQLGKQTITVKVGEYETTIEITVSGRVVLSIEAIGYNQYVDQGKEYNFDGKVIAHYNDNTSEEVSGYTVEKVDTTGHGPQTVKVSYEGRSVNITINVIQTKTDTSPTAMTAIIGGSVVGVAILAVGIFFLLKSFKI